MSALPDERRRPTIDDVARLAGVSRCTVGNISVGVPLRSTDPSRLARAKETRRRVQQAADQLGFTLGAGKGRRGLAPLRFEQQPQPRPVPPSPPRADLGLVDARAAAIIFSMNAQERHQYQMESVLPIVDQAGISLADEDYDTTPVPTGCAGCWSNGSEPCLTCPSRPTAAQLRQVRSEVVAFNRWR